jgi:hypothetical protein
MTCLVFQSNLEITLITLQIIYDFIFVNLEYKSAVQIYTQIKFIRLYEINYLANY